MPFRLAILTALLLGPVQVLQTSPPAVAVPSPYPRVAAVQFAIQKGWQFPKTDVVVAIDAFFGFVDGHPDR